MPPVERVEAKNLTFNPIRMAFLESYWLVAAAKEDFSTMGKYMSEGFIHQFHLNEDSAQKATTLQIRAIGTENVREKAKRYTSFYELLSKASGLGFDPQEATEAKMVCDNTPSVTNFNYLFGVIYGINPNQLKDAMTVRVEVVVPEYQMAFSHGISEEDSWDHIGKMNSKLIEYYQLLQQALSEPQTA